LIRQQSIEQIALFLPRQIELRAEIKERVTLAANAVSRLDPFHWNEARRAVGYCLFVGYLSSANVSGWEMHTSFRDFRDPNSNSPDSSPDNNSHSPCLHCFGR
jgi:hypothetical protein